MANVSGQHPLSRGKQEDPMGAVVTADFTLGGRTNVTRAKLKKIIRALGISDPRNRLPTGRNARYILVLKTPAAIPVPKAKASRRKRRT